MIVYCDMDCKHAVDGQCCNRWESGRDAIKIGGEWWEGAICTDYEETEPPKEET